MSWPGYVPKIIWENFGDMIEDLKKYGMLSKHEADHADLFYLFNTIKQLRIEVANLKTEMKAREEYTTNLEYSLSESLKKSTR